MKSINRLIYLKAIIKRVAYVIKIIFDKNKNQMLKINAKFLRIDKHNQFDIDLGEFRSVTAL